METLLVLAAGALQVPAITTAKRMGLRVVAADGNAKAPGLALADKAYVINIRDVGACFSLARKENVNGVIHICSEVSMFVMGRINEKLNLKGVDSETAVRSTNKERMRRAFDAFGAPSPRSIGAATEAEAIKAAEDIGRPLVVKPSRNSGSRGVTCIKDDDSREKFLQAFRLARKESRDFTVVIEEFVDGPEFSVEILVWDGQPHILAATDKITTDCPHFVVTGHSEPTRQSPENRRLIEEAAIKGVKALGIDWAAVHAELRLTSRGPMLMEIGARLGGDYIATELVPHSTGIDMVEGAINLALGRVPDLTPRHKPRGAAIRYFTPPPGRVTNIIGLDKVHSMPGVKIVDLGIHVGDIVSEFTSSLSRVGHIITEGATAEEAIANAEAARDAVTFELEPIKKIHAAALAAGRVDKQIETVKRKKQKSILVLAAGPLQIPAIIAAKRLGLRVVAADGDPMAPGLNLADASYVIDILDKNECLKLVKKERIFASAHICSEVSLQVRGWLNDVMGMNGISLATAIRSTNKQKMREAFEAGGAPNPKWFAVQTVDEALAAADKIGRPIIFKPTRNSGKRGVTVLNGQVTQHDLIEAFNYALRQSRDPGVMIEEFVEGPEFSVETLTWYGHTHIIAVTDKCTTGAPHCVETGHSIPTMLPDDKRQLVEDAAVSAVHALGIDWAPCHVEIKLTDRGPILMEVGARLGGGYITTELVPRATGIDMVEAAITLNIGRKPRLIPSHQPRGAAIRHIWPKPGKVVAIRGLDKARGVRDVKIIELFIRPGDVIQEIVSCGQRIGHVIAEGATAAEAIANAEAARDTIEIVTE